MTDTHASPARPPTLIIVAPTFNHAHALGAVLQSLHSIGLPIIVVNDGATDHTGTVLADWLAGATDPESRRVVTHERNRGKAAALRTGFAEAALRGFTHAITIDTDGQHDGADLPAIIALAKNRPEALVIGARSQVGGDGVRPPLASRIGRAVSNRLVLLESGVRVSDSQSGMRVYPLAEMNFLSARAARYGFETEILTRAGWRGLPVIESPIRCVYDVPGGRTTHFRIGRDSLAAVAMHARLITLALLPGHPRRPGHEPPLTGSIPRRLAAWLSPRRVWRMARGGKESRDQLAASLGVGLLMATLPLYGVKTAICLWLSARFRLHPLIVVGTSSLSTPPLGFVFAMLSICAGSIVLRGSMPALTLHQIESAGVWETLRTMLWEWIVGSAIAGTLLGLTGYWAAKVMLACVRASDDPAMPSPPPATVQSAASAER